MAQNQGFFDKIMDDKTFSDDAKALIMNLAYNRLTASK